MPLKNALCFVQFIHPGKEHRLDLDGKKAWNRRVHKRKFVECEGQCCLRRGHCFEGLLRFWTEWEPESDVITEIDEQVPNGPRFIYRPYYVVPKSYTGLQNTDPYVFGDFHYTGCQQNTKRGPTQLRFLSRGSVILFGSSVDGKFAIDTVFVVDKYEDHDARDYIKLKKLVSPLYWDVTLATWYKNNSSKSSCAEGLPSHSWRLYWGATHDSPVEGMFSFFPCMPAASSPKGFPRPAIVNPTIITEGLLQGKRTNRQLGLSIDEVRKLWIDVCTQVESQKLWLGTHADRPERRDS